MELNEIYEFAEKELKIELHTLDYASSQIPIIHLKFMKILINEAKVLRSLKLKLTTMYKDKKEYYLGIADPSAYLDKQLPDHIIKAEVNIYIETDKDYAELAEEVAFQEEKIKFVDGIIKLINKRDFIIRNSIEDRKYKQGMN